MSVPISGISQTNHLGPASSGSKISQGVVEIKKSSSFQEKLDATRQSSASGQLFGNGSHEDLVKMGQNLLNSPKVDAKNLILYQIKASQFHLRVELVSKCSESLLATMRKFQNPQ